MPGHNSTFNLFGRIFTVLSAASVLLGAIPASAQNQRAAPGRVQADRKTIRPVAESTSPIEANFPKTESSVMSQPWRRGALPAPLPVPAGNPDEIAALLAQKVAAKTDESVPALLTALQLAGFFITDKNGQVAFAPPDGKGQGLSVNGWEIASMAKMFGEGKRVPLAELDKSLQTVPTLSKIPQNDQKIGSLLIDGIKANAVNTDNRFLRTWARLIIELGKFSRHKYDLPTADAGRIELDPVQHFLITRRLYGDLWARAEKYRFQMLQSKLSNASPARFVRASFNPVPAANSTAISTDLEIKSSHPIRAGILPEDDKTIPCRMDGNAPTVMDAGATLSGVGWDKLLGYLEDAYEGTPAEAAIKKFGLFQAAANTILAYAKFIQTYAALETRIVAEDAAPLIRTKNGVPGGRKRLRAEVRMDIGDWQMYNCIRMVMNTTTGLDFATLNDGPLGDVGVQWGLTKGGAGDLYSNSTGVNQAGEQIVGFAADAPRRVQSTTGRTNQITAGNVTYTKTDGQGLAENILEGTPQRNAKIGRVSEVTKEARVFTSIKLKAGEVKGDIVDVAGQAIAGIPGLITMPTELLYRTSWAASGALLVPVIDWEECQGGWSGTISIVRRSSESWKQDGEKKGVRSTTASASTSRTYKYEGTINIENANAFSSGGYSTLNKAVSSINVPLKADSNATSETVWEDESTSYYEDNCGQRNARKILYKKSRKEETGTGRGLAEGNLFIDLAGNRYRFQIAIPAFAGKDTRMDFRRPSGYCRPEDNKPQDGPASESSIEIAQMPIEISDGVLDPKNPNVIEGSRSFTSPGGEEIEIRWSFRNCR